MSQRKGRKSQTLSQDDDDGSSQEVVIDKELERKVNEMVRYILFSDSKMVGLKRGELVKNVLKEHSKLYNVVMKETANKLSTVFGYELVEMENEEGKTKGYILTNKIERKFDDDISKMLDSDEDKHRLGLLTIILSLIFMNEGPITEVSLWHTLNKFGLYKDREHDVFGNLDKLLNTELVKQSYLDRIKVQGHEGPTYQYNWGARSRKEVSKRKILEFVSEVYGVESIKDWKVQYEHVLSEERPQKE